MMKSVLSDQLECFADIYSKDVELVCMTHSQSSYMDSLGKEILSAREDIELQWIQSLDDLRIVDELLPMSVESEGRQMLANQIKESCCMLQENLNCKYVGVRLLTLNKPMCPRFHVDQIPCRLLITISGGGTEWIPNEDVDWEVFEDTTNQDVPLKENIEKLFSCNGSVLIIIIHSERSDNPCQHVMQVQTTNVWIDVHVHI